MFKAIEQANLDDKKIAENQEEKYNIEELQMKLNDLEKKLEECVEVFII